MEYNKIKYPRILVISNNAFSDTSNNGKTLASFFKEYPEDKIAQLYFCSETPNNKHCHNYFRITDEDVIKCFVKKSNICGSRIYGKITLKNRSYQRGNCSLATILKNYDLFRIIRELFWKREKWKTELLEQWLTEFSPKIIFFCAGDSGFAYDITTYIQEKFRAKLVMYITDDDVLPRKTISPFCRLRRNYILNKTRNAVGRSDLFITISQQMKDIYRELFNKDSIVAVNMTESMKDESITSKNNKEITLVYAGGIHYKRYITLNLLAQSLKKYNNDPNNKKKAYLKIYSTQEHSRVILKYLDVEGASKFCGKLNAIQLKSVLNSCDIPVHVESFDSKSIESTKLSISTKIPEYLSLGKPVLAIGPSEVASIQYLEDSAFCIIKIDCIYSEVKKLLNDTKLCKELSQKALLKFQKNHKTEIVLKKLIENIINV